MKKTTKENTPQRRGRPPMPKGLTQKDITAFLTILVKANTEQLYAMGRAMNAQIDLRELRNDLKKVTP